MSEIQDEAYTELCQENERVSKQLAKLKFLNAQEHITIDELAKLCLRAADALDEYSLAIKDCNCPECKPIYELITELRKAAE